MYFQICFATDLKINKSIRHDQVCYGSLHRHTTIKTIKLGETGMQKEKRILIIHHSDKCAPDMQTVTKLHVHFIMCISSGIVSWGSCVVH